MVHPHHGGHFGGALLAAVAALGYWVLRSAEKDPVVPRWAGRVVGWSLLAVGLLGFLCGTWSHMTGAGRGACPHGGCSWESRMEERMDLPPGHPPLGGMDSSPRKKSR